MNIEKRSTCSRWITGLSLAALCLPAASRRASAQQTDTGRTRRDTGFAMAITAGEADAEPRRRQLLNRARFDLGFMTLHVGGGLLFDVAAYSPDSAIRQHFELEPIFKLRDARFLLGGRFAFKRAVTWQTGVMYDQPTKKWLFRQTGIMVAIPELWAHVFVGRAKEGFSLNKVMVGYDGWSMERLPFTDATIPLLADGVKWLGITPDRHWFWNVGWFTDWLSEGQTFSSYDNQFVVRAGWVPLVSDSTGTLLHVALNLRRGRPNEGALQLRSRPEAFPAPYFIDTGKFPAQSSRQAGFEVYYRPGRLLLGTEYSWQQVSSRETGNPSFSGGEVVIAWLTTGETRTYNTVGNYFRGVSPDSTVVQGGPGAWEFVLKFSYSDLTNQPLEGGIFRRLTPMVNWHLTDNVRLELTYGYGTLARFGVVGRTHFFQSRLQMQL